MIVGFGSLWSPESGVIEVVSGIDCTVSVAAPVTTETLSGAVTYIALVTGFTPIEVAPADAEEVEPPLKSGEAGGFPSAEQLQEYLKRLNPEDLGRFNP